MKDGKFFNVRVYALLLNADNELLIAEEYHFDTFMRKLPGGGLHFGEGVKDAVIRELREELDIEVENVEHFYTTDFFIQSAFNPDHQVIGIYYRVEMPENLTDRYREEIKVPNCNGDVCFRWVHLESLRAEDFTFPADQAAIRLLLSLEQD